MKGTFKRAIALILVIVTALSVLTSCDRSYDEEEVVAAAKELLPTAAVLNSVYYGNGINASASGYQNGSYYEADFLHLNKLGFDTVAELEALTMQTFSVKYASSIIDYYLHPAPEGEPYRTVRYYQAYDLDDPTVPVRIMVYSKHVPIFDDRLTYDLDTVKAVGSTKDIVNMTVEATVKDADGNEQRVTVRFGLYEEKVGWRISGTCFANYNKTK
jgi:hypothetical protein